MENVITSPEVESYVFGDNSDPVTVPTAFAGRAFGEVYDPVTRQNKSSYISNVDSALGFTAGDLLTLAGTVSNNGTFTIGSVVPDPNNAAICTVYPTPNSPIKFQDEDPLPGGTTFTLNTESDYLIAGPYRAQKLGQVIDRIDCDIIFQRGLYRVDGTSGKFKTNSVTMEFTYQMIDENTGDPINAPIVYQHTFTSKKRTTLRATITSNAIPPGAYQVTVKRQTPIPDDDREYEEVTWAGLKGKIVNSTERTYGPVTLLAIRMKATNGLGAAARERIRVTAKRRLPNNRDSSNPITVIGDIWTNTVYGLARPVSELDFAYMYPLELEWAGPDGPKFNGSFDQRNTGYEAMQQVISMTGGKIVQNGGLTTVALDREQPVRTAMFTSANIARGSLEIQYSFDTTTDYNCVQIEYRDPISFQPAFVTYPPDGTLPDTYTLFGCTDAVYAQQYARYLHNVRTIRRKQVKFTTELDGLIPRFGDRISIAHPLPSWGHSGVIIDVIDATTFRVDSNLNWSGGEKVMRLRSPVGQPSSPYVVTRGEADNIVIFPEVPDVEVNGPEGMEPTSYAFGENGSPIIQDFILSKVTPVSQTTVEIEGQTYTANIYTGAPPHMRV